MGKDKKKKDKAPEAANKPKKAKKAKKAKPALEKAAKADAASAAATVEGAVRAAKDKVVEIASNPVVAEIVAATLVAAAAALRNPEKARQLADSAGEELGEVTKGAAGKGGAFWELATDVARRTIAALDDDGRAGRRSGAKGSKAAKG